MPSIVQKNKMPSRDDPNSTTVKLLTLLNVSAVKNHGKRKRDIEANDQEVQEKRIKLNRRKVHIRPSGEDLEESIGVALQREKDKAEGKDKGDEQTREKDDGVKPGEDDEIGNGMSSDYFYPFYSA